MPLLETVLFVLYKSKTKSNLLLFWGMSDILFLSSTSQYFPYVLERLGRFILTNTAPPNSLTSTSSGLSEGLSTGQKQANKSNFVLHCRNCQLLEMEIG